MVDVQAQKNDDYYRTARDELHRHLPARMENILEIGCGAGQMMTGVRANWDVKWAAGVEYDQQSARDAEAVFDKVAAGDVETVDWDTFLDGHPIDTVIATDILEHLVDPWSVVKKLTERLQPGGHIIISIPNIRYYKVITDLAFRGRFEYREQGVMDSTHLRWFTRLSAIKLAECGGAKLVRCERVQKFDTGKRILNAVTFGRAHDFLLRQFCLVAQKPDDGTA